MMMELRRVSGGYPHFKVEEVTLRLRRGEFFAVLGPNGSGKSTLLKLMTGILSPDQGEILLNGLPLTRYSAAEKGRLISVLGQEEQVHFDFTVEEIVSLGRFPHQRGWFSWLRSRDKQVIRQAMEATQILNYKDQPFRRLSGGEKQRVLLAKALAQEPQLLFLDEPTNHLDLHHALQLLELLREWQSSKELTVFAILHDLNLACLYADRIGLMTGGRLEVVDDVSLLKDGERLEQVYQIQLDTIAHPHLPRPQFIPAPAVRAKQDRSGLLYAYQLSLDDELLQVRFDHPLKVLAHAPLGSGFHWATHFCHFRLKHGTGGHQVRNELMQQMSRRQIPAQQAVVQLTSAHLTDHVLVEQESEGIAFLVLAVAGTGPEGALHQPLLSRQKPPYPPPEAIHIMVCLDAYLTEGDFVNAVIAASAAKARALQSLLGSVPPSTVQPLAADGMVIAATQTGAPIPHGGAIAKEKQLLGELVYQAALSAVEKCWQRLEKASLRN